MISDWIGRLVKLHIGRSGRVDWPDADTDEGEAFWLTWADAFRRKGVDFETADEASHVVAAMGIGWPNEHLPKILEECARIFRERQSTSSGHEPGSKGYAIAEMDPACECQGHGLVGRYRHQDRGDGRAQNAAGALVTCYCSCSVGRWVKSRHPPEIAARIVDIGPLSDLMFEREINGEVLPCQFRYHPDDWDEATKQPRPVRSWHPADSETIKAGGRIITEVPKGATAESPELELTWQQQAEREARRKQMLSELPVNHLVAAAAMIVGDTDDVEGLGIDMRDPPPEGTFDDDDDPWFYEV